MAWLSNLWWRLIDTCSSGQCDKLGYICKPLEPLSKPVCEDILMEIFSRMPAESLHQCKLVYEDWDTLFSTPYFIHNMFLPRASPTIIVQCLDKRELFYVDDDHRGGLKCRPISLKHPLHTYITPISFSCYGLLFLDLYDSVGYVSTVVNPITGKWTPIPRVSKVEGKICGAYIHPTTKEFRVLWVSTWTTANKYTHFEYKLLRPRSGKPLEICWNALSKLQSRPMTNEPPVNLHDCLHWMDYKYKSIIVFSIMKEEFMLMHSIPSEQSSQDKLKPMHLLDLDGYLSLWELTDDILNIWTVEDYYASWSWTKRYSIDVKLLHKSVNVDEVSVVGYQNGALVIHGIGKGIFVYHLQHNSTKKFLFYKLKGRTTAFLHTKSLISFYDSVFLR